MWLPHSQSQIQIENQTKRHSKQEERNTEMGESEARRGESRRVVEAQPKRPFKRRFMCPADFYDSLIYVYS